MSQRKAKLFHIQQQDEKLKKVQTRSVSAKVKVLELKALNEITEIVRERGWDYVKFQYICQQVRTRLGLKAPKKERSQYEPIKVPESDI